MNSKINKINKEIHTLSIISIIQHVYELMKLIEKRDDNINKRETLHEQICALLGNEIYCENKDNIDYAIETIIFLSKNNNIKGINDIKKCCVSYCLSSCIFQK